MYEGITALLRSDHSCHRLQFVSDGIQLGLLCYCLSAPCKEYKTYRAQWRALWLLFRWLLVFCGFTKSFLQGSHICSIYLFALVFYFKVCIISLLQMVMWIFPRGSNLEWILNHSEYWSLVEGAEEERKKKKKKKSSFEWEFPLLKWANMNTLNVHLQATVIS